MSHKTLNFLVILFTLAVGYFLNALILQWCWNYLMPTMFNLPEATYIQSLMFMAAVAVLKHDYVLEKP